MAAIDKTYANKEELIEIIDWCLKIGECTLENGYKFRPLDFIYDYNELDENYQPINEQTVYVVWNTSVWFDRWLWLNCPIETIKKRLREQYDDKYLKKFEDYVYVDYNDNPMLGRQKYKFLKEPKWHLWKWWANNYRRNSRWPGNYKQATIEMEIILPKTDEDNSDYDFMRELKYNSVVDRWYKSFYSYMPWTKNTYIWQKYHKRIPTKKSIIRMLRHWWFPSGTIIKISAIRLKIDWEIKVI